jgi:hypothetical protein
MVQPKIDKFDLPTVVGNLLNTLSFGIVISNDDNATFYAKTDNFLKVAGTMEIHNDAIKVFDGVMTLQTVGEEKLLHFINTIVDTFNNNNNSYTINDDIIVDTFIIKSVKHMGIVAKTVTNNIQQPSKKFTAEMQFNITYKKKGGNYGERN